METNKQMKVVARLLLEQCVKWLGSGQRKVLLGEGPVHDGRKKVVHVAWATEVGA